MDSTFLGGFTVGQHVQAHEVYSKVWRPARIAQFTMSEYYGPGCYIYWLDVDPADLSKSQGGWHPLSSIRRIEKVPHDFRFGV